MNNWTIRVLFVLSSFFLAFAIGTAACDDDDDGDTNNYYDDDNDDTSDDDATPDDDDDTSDDDTGDDDTGDDDDDVDDDDSTPPDYALGFPTNDDYAVVAHSTSLNIGGNDLTLVNPDALEFSGYITELAKRFSAACK